MKCLICEKELEDVNPDTPEMMQPYYGGEVKFRFDYGSRYDWMGARQPSYIGDPKDQEFMTIPEFGPSGEDIKLPVSNWSEPGISMDDETYTRAEKLSACSHIRAVICDDCFEAKSHLIDGYEKCGPDEPIKKVL